MILLWGNILITADWSLLAPLRKGLLYEPLDNRQLHNPNVTALRKLRHAVKIVILYLEKLFLTSDLVAAPSG